ncbi:MAG: DUF1573 domain-containing protein, partial [Nitriliruptor sp.]
MVGVLLAVLALTLTLTPPLMATAGAAEVEEAERAAPSQRPEDRGGGPVIEGRYIVVVHDDANPARVARDNGLTPRRVYRTAVTGFATEASDDEVASLEADERVRWVEAERLEQITTQSLPTGVDRIEADRNPTITTDGTGTAVDLDIAVIDSGIQPDHPDLDVAGGRNFTSSGGTEAWEDGNGHGTHVAGTIGALDNDQGVIGVAPGAQLWSLKVCPNNRCEGSAILAAIDWMTEQKLAFHDNGGTEGIDFAAANYSITSADTTTPCSGDSGSRTGVNATHTAICGAVDAGIPFVLSAGNDNRLKDPYPESFSVSAIADFDGMAGGAVTDFSDSCRSDNTDDTLATFSNYGPNVKIAAPGTCILSTWTGSDYRTISGTSMSAPHVTGAIALALHATAKPPATDAAGVADLETLLLEAAHPQGTDNHPASYDDTRLGGPLLFVNADSLGGDGTVGIAGLGPVNVRLSADQQAYEPDVDTTATLTGNVFDDQATPISGLEATDFTATLDDVDISDDLAFSEASTAGTYSAALDIEGWAKGDYLLEVTVASGSAFDSDTVTITIGDPPPSLAITSVTYATSRGGNQLNFTVTARDQAGDLVAGAEVGTRTTNSETGRVALASGTTGSDGTLTINWNNAPDGCSVTQITNLAHPDYEADPATPPNSSCSISGNVAGLGNVGPIEGAEVTAAGPGTTPAASTDEDGAYVLYPSHRGDWDVTAAADGFVSRTETGIAVSGGKIIEVTGIDLALSQPPVAADYGLTTTRDKPVTVDVLADSSHPDGEEISLISWGEPGNDDAIVSCELEGDLAGECTYTPERGFDGEDAFTYTISDPNGATAVGTVSVSVTYDALVADPPSIDFGEVEIGATGEAATTVTNDGNREIEITAATTDGTAFDVVTDLSDPIALPPGRSTPLEVTFKPDAEGEFPAKLTVTHTGDNDPLAIDLSGTGVAPLPRFEEDAAGVVFSSGWSTV